MPSAIAPTLLPPNPVWRSYLGGSVLRQFRSVPHADDNHFPEDWLASTVQARNGEHASGPFDGLSPVFLPDPFRQDPKFWFGSSYPAVMHTQGPGVLWKLLDSSVRLQFQAHPSAAFARKHLNSNARKTECWYILSTRGDSHVYLGFQHPPSRQEWGSMIRDQRVEDMMACFEKIPVKTGECYIVPAGTPHAIGAGIFMVELMEPTDWVVRCETVNAGFALSPEACFMGLGLDACLDVFDYSGYSIDDVRKKFQQYPRLLAQTGNSQEEEIIGPAWHRFFRLHRLRGTGPAEWPGNELMLAIILQGEGELSAGADACHCQQGQTWLLPGAANRLEMADKLQLGTPSPQTPSSTNY